MKLAIVGNRQAYRDHPVLVRRMIEQFIDHFAPVDGGDEYIIITGRDSDDQGGDGVDQAVAAHTKLLIDDGAQVDLLVFKPDTETWGGEFGHYARNCKIAAECDAIVVILSIGSDTQGANFTARRADICGKKIYTVTLP